jgi:hypothetical protein
MGLWRGAGAPAVDCICGTSEIEGGACFSEGSRGIIARHGAFGGFV